MTDFEHVNPERMAEEMRREKPRALFGLPIVEMPTWQVVYPRCETCKHAVEITETQYGARRETVKSHPLACVRVEMSDGRPDIPETKAVSMDGSDFAAGLWVSRDFGCIMHEFKTP